MNNTDTYNSVRSKINILTYWMLPRGVEVKIRSQLRRFLDLELQKKIYSNIKLKNIQKNQECFILGTGPSIKKQDLSKLNGRLCISVGEFYLHPEIKYINPIFHVQAANHAPYKFDEIYSIFDKYNELLPHSTELVFGHTRYKYSYYAALKNYNGTLLNKIHFINYIGSVQLSKEIYDNSKYWDISKTPFVCRTVVFMAIQLAVYLGCNKIYLLGCDHDYILRCFNNKSFSDHHFYNDQKSSYSTVSDYLSEFSLANWFEEYHYRWLQYDLMRRYLSSMGVDIINATEGGILDVFPQVILSDVIAKVIY